MSIDVQISGVDISITSLPPVNYVSTFVNLTVIARGWEVLVRLQGDESNYATFEHSPYACVLTNGYSFCEFRFVANLLFIIRIYAIKFFVTPNSICNINITPNNTL